MVLPLSKGWQPIWPHLAEPLPQERSSSSMGEELRADPVLGTVPGAGKPAVNQTKSPPRVFPLVLWVYAHMAPLLGSLPLFPPCHSSRLDRVLFDPSPSHSGLSETVSITAVSLTLTSTGWAQRNELLPNV